MMQVGEQYKSLHKQSNSKHVFQQKLAYQHNPNYEANKIKHLNGF